MTRSRLFLGWLLFLTAAPALASGLAVLLDGPAWLSPAPWLGLLLALVSVSVVVPPRSLGVRGWLADVAARAAAAIAPIHPRSTTTKEQPR